MWKNLFNTKAKAIKEYRQLVCTFSTDYLAYCTFKHNWSYLHIKNDTKTGSKTMNKKPGMELNYQLIGKHHKIGKLCDHFAALHCKDCDTSLAARKLPSGGLI